MPLPLAVAAGLGLVSSVGGIVQTLQGASKQREAEKASEKFATEIKNLRAKNLMEGIGIPMRGFDLAKEAQAQRYATGVAALQSAGAEGVLGGLTGLERQQGQQDLALAAQLEKMEYARNLERARQAQAIENQATGREAQLGFMRLQGAGQAAAEGARQQQAGIQGIVGGLGTAAELGLKYAPLYGKDDPTGTTLGTGGTNMINVGGNTSQISPIGPTAANKAGFMGPYNLPNYGPFQPNYNLHNLWDPSTNSLGGPQRPNPFGIPQSHNPWSFQGAGANPFTVPSMNIGSSSWLGGNNYP